MGLYKKVKSNNDNTMELLDFSSFVLYIVSILGVDDRKNHTWCMTVMSNLGLVLSSTLLRAHHKIKSIFFWH